MSWKASPNFFFSKVCLSQTSLLLDFLSPPSLFLWMAHVKSNMFKLEGLKLRVFILYEELFICVWFTTVHG